jgi:hypothetical protein
MQFVEADFEEGGVEVHTRKGAGQAAAKDARKNSPEQVSFGFTIEIRIESIL